MKKSRAFQIPQILHTSQWGEIWNQNFTRLPKLTEDNFFHEGIFIPTKIWYDSIQTSVSYGRVVLFKGKVGGNFQVYRCTRSFQFLVQIDSKAWISGTGFLN